MKCSIVERMSIAPASLHKNQHELLLIGEHAYLRNVIVSWRNHGLTVFCLSPCRLSIQLFLLVLFFVVSHLSVSQSLCNWHLSLCWLLDECAYWALYFEWNRGRLIFNDVLFVKTLSAPSKQWICQCNV